jgi:hypothetical protein
MIAARKPGTVEAEATATAARIGGGSRGERGRDSDRSECAKFHGVCCTDAEDHHYRYRSPQGAEIE